MGCERPFKEVRVRALKLLIIWKVSRRVATVIWDRVIVRAANPLGARTLVVTLKT